MDPEPEQYDGTGAASSNGWHPVSRVAPDGNVADGNVADGNVADGNVADGRLADAHDPAAEREREIRDGTDRERRLRDLVMEVGFAGTFAAMAGLARRWAEHPEADTRAAAELRLLGRRLDALAQDVGTSTRLS